MTSIHPTAIIDRRAELGEGVKVGPYVVIEGRVRVGAGCVIEAHSVLRGPSAIGARCRIGPAAYVGLDPQHLKLNANETESWLIVGDECVIREGASLHRATHEGLEHATRLGDRCFLMANSHVGHDARLGNDVVMANAVLIGGHVTVGDRTFLGGGSAIHQFCRVGRLVVIAGNESVARDIPPFAAARYGGISVKRSYVLAMAISGTFAGLAGAIDILGWQFRLGVLDIQVSNIGFIGIAVALLGRNTALGVGLAALLFGSLVNGTSTRGLDPSVFPPQLAGNLTLMIQALVLLFVGADVLVLYLWQARRVIGFGRRRSPPAPQAEVVS